MRIISWNCNGRFAGRFDLLAEYNADVYCIQECESPEYTDFNFAGQIYWDGYLKYKGLATFVKEGLASEKLDWNPYGTCYFIPVRIGHQYDLINVWTQPGYVSEWYIYQQLHIGKFDRNTIMCGDFNSFEKNPKTASGFRTHENCVSQLNSIGLYQNENIEPTFFHRYNINQPFRLDYCFAGKEIIRNIEVGNPDKWLKYSDHMPLIIDVND